jgi:hypothetical protein
MAVMTFRSPEAFNMEYFTQFCENIAMGKAWKKKRSADVTI